MRTRSCPLSVAWSALRPTVESGGIVENGAVDSAESDSGLRESFPSFRRPSQLMIIMAVSMLLLLALLGHVEREKERERGRL